MRQAPAHLQWPSREGVWAISRLSSESRALRRELEGGELTDADHAGQPSGKEGCGTNGRDVEYSSLALFHF